MAIYRCCPKGDCVSNFTTTGATGVKHSCVKNGYFHRPSETGKTYKFSYVYQCKDGAWSSQYVRNMTSCPPNYCKFGFFCYNSGFCRYGDAGVVKCNPNDPVRGPWVKVTSTRSCSYKEF